MGLHSRTKVKNLLTTEAVSGTVFLLKDLAEKGYSRQDLAKYTKGGWLKMWAHGVYYKAGETPTAYSLVAAAQRTGFPAHIGGASALDLWGVTHYLRTESQVHLVGSKRRPPSWLTKPIAGTKVTYRSTAALSEDLGVTEKVVENFSLRVSTMERAALEYALELPLDDSLDEASHLFEGLRSLRPNEVMTLLKACKSNKAKRLFLFLADHCKLPWLKEVDISAIDLGKGILNVAPKQHKTTYIPKFRLAVSTTLKTNEESSPEF